MPDKPMQQVVTEVGERNGNYVRVEIGEKEMQGKSAIDYLQYLVTKKFNEGWFFVTWSNEEAPKDPVIRYYQFQVPKEKDVGTLKRLIGAFNLLDSSEKGWIDPEQIPKLDANPVPNVWSITLQLGAQRIELCRVTRNKAILLARVPVESVADKVLRVLANNKIGIQATVSSSDGSGIDPKTLIKRNSPEPWCSEFGYEVGAYEKAIELVCDFSDNECVIAF